MTVLNGNSVKWSQIVCWKLRRAFFWRSAREREDAHVRTQAEHANLWGKGRIPVKIALGMGGCFLFGGFLWFCFWFCGFFFFFATNPKMQWLLGLPLLHYCVCSQHLNKQSCICGSLGICQDSSGKEWFRASENSGGCFHASLLPARTITHAALLWMDSVAVPESKYTAHVVLGKNVRSCNGTKSWASGIVPARLAW